MIGTETKGGAKLKDFIITTDNTADLPYSYYTENQVDYMYLPYTMDG